MFNSFVNVIWKVDIVLCGLAFFLCAAIICHGIAQNYAAYKRSKKLWAIKKTIYGFLNLQNASGQSFTKNLSRKISPRIFLDVMTNRERKDVFFNESEQKFFKTTCLSSGKLAQFQKIAQKSFNKWRRIEALLALGYTDDEKSFNVLKNGLQNKDPEIAYFAAVGLGQKKNLVSAQALIGFMKRKGAPHYKIASILAQFPPETASQTLELIKSENPMLRFWGLRIITGLKNDSLSAEAEKLIEDPNPEVRAAACQYLGTIQYKHAIEKIRLRAKDDFWNVRAQSLLALESILGDKCIPDVLHFIGDNSWLVLDKLKKVLAGHIEASLPHLEKIFSGTDRLAKKIAVETIGLAGCTPQLFEDLTSEPAKKERSLRLIKGLLETGAFETLESVVNKLGHDHWEKILTGLESTDKTLAGELQFMLKTKQKEP